MLRDRWRSVDYWDAGARWYDLWLRHNSYHAPIQSVLAARVRPDWRILDIGGGSGVLSLFLRRIGCRIVLLEPAGAMRALFSRDAAEARLEGFEVDPRRWEDVPLADVSGFDLILACNSLHVTSLGFESALERVFAAGARHVCVVAEHPKTGSPGRRRTGYVCRYSERRAVSSSRAYHHPEEALEQAAFVEGRALSAAERREGLKGLVFENDHYWIKGTAVFNLEWWTRSNPEE